MSAGCVVGSRQAKAGRQAVETLAQTRLLPEARRTTAAVRVGASSSSSVVRSALLSMIDRFEDTKQEARIINRTGGGDRGPKRRRKGHEAELVFAFFTLAATCFAA